MEPWMVVCKIRAKSCSAENTHQFLLMGFESQLLCTMGSWVKQHLFTWFSKHKPSRFGCGCGTCYPYIPRAIQSARS
eukprot:scaffold297479_cov15-Tisochrysis_lutea.AAC.1